MLRQLSNWNKYITGYAFIYLIAASILYFGFHQSLSDLATVLLSFGIGLSLAAWLLVKHIHALIPDQPIFNKEVYVLSSLVLFFAWYVTFGAAQLNMLIPKRITAEPRYYAIAVVLKKLIVFVLLPFWVYRICGFTLKDFGLVLSRNALRNKSNWITFSVLSILILLFQYLFSNGARPFHEHAFSVKQLVIGLPLLFSWLFVEVGLVEEFFFRAVLQTRIAVLVKSRAGGIVISGLIFGLAHAPGLYLRGAASEGVQEQLPFIFWAAYTISVMSLAGIFLGIVWSRTKNLWLVMALHAMVDLLPNFQEFVHTWNI